MRKLFLFIVSSFISGFAAGSIWDSNTSVNTNNFVSSTTLDTKAPTKDICLTYGSSAIVLDNRNYITLNPFRVYISQTKVRPACVLKDNNWVILEQRYLINNEQVKLCKNKMNTFGYIGELNQSPEIDCIYESNTALNTFLGNQKEK
nr:DUF3172-containing protein [Cavernulicola chilensis]